MTTTHRELRYKPIMTDEMKAAAVAALEDGGPALPPLDEPAGGSFPEPLLEPLDPLLDVLLDPVLEVLLDLRCLAARWAAASSRARRRAAR